VRDRVDSALDVLRRAERWAVVEEGPTIPVPIPPRSLQRHLQLVDVLPPPLRPFRLAAFLGQPRELPEVGVQEPAEPDALSLPLVADPIHTIVPIAGSHQRQTVFSHGEASVYRPPAVLAERSRLASA